MLIVVPLLTALLHATYEVDRLVAQGQRALFATVRATQSSQLLLEAITDMERSARQYRVLGEQALLQVYEENHQKFVDTAKRLSALNLPVLQRERLDLMLKVEG